MKARVVERSAFGMITACGGIDFTKTEWRNVPAHEEASARTNPNLEVVEEVKGEDEVTFAVFGVFYDDAKLQKTTDENLKHMLTHHKLSISGDRKAWIKRLHKSAAEEQERMYQASISPEGEDVVGDEKEGLDPGQISNVIVELKDVKLKEHTAKELNEILEYLKLPITGNKSVKIKRINKFIAENEAGDE